MRSRVVRCIRRLVLSGCLLSAAAAGRAQLASEVKDLNTTAPRSLGLPLMPDLATLGSTMLFALDDGSTGRELWRLDGLTGITERVADLCPGPCPSSPVQLTVMGGAAFFTASDGVHGYELWKSDGTAAGTVLVKDINPGIGSSFFGRFASVGGALYFAANDGVHGSELWTSDGTAAGTRLVADINPGPGFSNPYIQADSLGRLFLTAADGSHGQEPWISDGTAAGTHLIRDLNPGPASSISFPYIVEGDETALGLADGTFVFSADDGSQGEELWRTDGTDAGTALIKDINPGTAGSEPISFALLGNKIYFSASTPAAGAELWVTDRTEAGTVQVKDVSAGTNGSRPARLTVAGGRLYFSVSYRQLWVSDGTDAGTAFLASGALLTLAPLGASVLALTGDPFTHGNQRLWKTDGTQAGTLELKNLGAQDFHCFTGYADPREVNGGLYFYDCKSGVGAELWKSDGTAAGTVLAQAPTGTPSFPFATFGTDSFLMPLPGGAFFSADAGVAGAQLWHTDGTPQATQPVPGVAGPGRRWPELQLTPPFQLGGVLIQDDNAAGLLRLAADGSGAEPLGAHLAPSPGYFQTAGGLYFFTSNTTAAGTELWKTDGTPAGTALVKDVFPGAGSSNPVFAGPLGSLFLFSANGDELWRTDGTNAGTVLIRDFWPGVFSVLQYPAVIGNLLYFVVVDDSQNWTLWKSDGTGAGTVRLKVFPPGTAMNGLVTAGGKVFLKLNDGTHGEELWGSDGTEAGTRLLADIRPGTASAGIEWLSDPGRSLLWFTADDGVHGREPWVSDGTEAGTHLLKDVRPGAESPALEWQSAPGQSLLYFTADDGVHGRELWLSDGTGAGTRLLKDVRPGPEAAGLGCCLAFVPGRLFFTADDGVHGTEVWVSDNTEAGTRLLKDVRPGPESSTPTSLLPLGRTLVFTASDGVHGAEPWVTSGTETGTFMLQDLAPGAPSSGPFLYTSAPPNVYFVADDGASGTELWTARKAALEPTFDDVHSTYWAWPYVEALAAAGFTGGCGNGLYCPAQTVTRAEVSAFILRGLHGTGYAPPPATGTVFQDVPAAYWAAPWIERFAAEGFSSGCATMPPRFCPETPVPRAQMAVFLLRARHGAGYAPPPATGTVFQDVPAGYWAAPWIERLAAEGITSGCASGLFCPDDPVGRDQMAVFLTRTFNLPLP